MASPLDEGFGVCPLGARTPDARCTLAEFIALCCVLQFLATFLLFTIGHKVFQCIVSSHTVNRAATHSAGGSSARKSLFLLGVWVSSGAIWYSCNNDRPWAVIGLAEAEFSLLRTVLVLVGGALLVVASFAFMFVHCDLGRNWSPVPEALDDHRLVVTGMYRIARHPMYMVFLWTPLAVLLATLNWCFALDWLVVFLVVVLPRLPQEEKILERAFGDEYARYQATTPPLGPGSQWLTRLYADGTAWRRACTATPADLNQTLVSPADA